MIRIFVGFILLIGTRAYGAALTPWQSLDPQVRYTVPASLEIFKGQGTDDLYPLEVDQTTGALPVEVVGGSASNPAASPTGSPVPADADYQGLNNSGTLIGAVGDSSGRTVVVGPGTAGSPVGGVLSIQGVASGTAVPISAASLPLPTGASTAAKQPALGTAGTASSDVITVQGIVSMTPLLVTQSGSGTQQPTNVAQFGGSNVVTGTGAGGSGIPRVTVSNDSTVGLVAGSAIVGKVGIDQTTPGTTNAVQVTATSAVTWQAEGTVAFGSVTGSYVTILTPSAGTKIVMLRNNTDVSISFSFDAGTTTNFVLDSGDQVSIDYVANGLLSGTAAIQIKSTSGAPSSGSVHVNACH